MSAYPDERSLVSRARLLTTKENVPDVAALVVVRLATSLVSVELLFEKTPVVVRNRDSVLRVLTTLLKLCRRSLRSRKLSSLASSKARFASTISIGCR